MANTQNKVTLTDPEAAAAVLAVVPEVEPVLSNQEATPNEPATAEPQTSVEPEADAEPVEPSEDVVGLPAPNYPVDSYGFTSPLRKEVRRAIGKTAMNARKATLLLETMKAATAYIEQTMVHRKLDV